MTLPSVRSSVSGVSRLGSLGAGLVNRTFLAPAVFGAISLLSGLIPFRRYRGRLLPSFSMTSSIYGMGKLAAVLIAFGLFFSPETLHQQFPQWEGSVRTFALVCAAFALAGTLLRCCEGVIRVGFWAAVLIVVSTGTNPLGRLTSPVQPAQALPAISQSGGGEWVDLFDRQLPRVVQPGAAELRRVSGSFTDSGFIEKLNPVPAVERKFAEWQRGAGVALQGALAGAGISSIPGIGSVADTVSSGYLPDSAYFAPAYHQGDVFSGTSALSGAGPLGGILQQLEGMPQLQLLQKVMQ